MGNNNTTVHKIAKYLRQEITYSNLKSGQHLKEADIAKKFKVSRVPVREAFRILQSEGYLDVIYNRGSFVKKLSMQYISETAIVYKALAPIVLDIAIPNYNEQTYRKGSKILDKIEECKDFNKVGYLLRDFAKTIFGPSKMKFILSLFDDMYLHNIRLLNEIFEIKQDKHYSTINHRRFLELCKMNLKEEAIAVWSSHIDQVKEIYVPSKK